MKARGIVVAIVVVSQFGCVPDVDDFAASVVPDSEISVAFEAMRLTQVGDYDAVRESFHSSVTPEQVGDDDLWNQLVEMLEGVDLNELKMIAVNVSTTPQGRMTVIGYEGEGARGWIQPTVRVRDGDLYGLNIVPMEGSLIEANSFRFSDIGVSHLILLLYGLATIGLAAFASYRVLGSAIPRRRLWAVLPFVMVGRASLVWPTGALGLQLLRVQLPPVTVLKAGPAAPWILGFGIPIFAVIALRKVAKHEAEKETEGEPAEGVV